MNLLLIKYIMCVELFNNNLVMILENIIDID